MNLSLPGPGVAAAKLRSRKPSLPDVVTVNLTLTCAGSFSDSGLVASTYERPLRASAQVLTPRHLYCREAGRDLYPAPEQLQQILRGEHVTLGLRQWA